MGFGPAGQLAAGYAGGVVLFNAQGQRLRLSPLKVEEVTGSVAFGAKGTLAAAYSGSNDSGVVLFDADPLSWCRKAAQTANRNFTLAEWTQYFPGTPYRRTVRSLPWPHDPSEAELKQAEAFEKEHPEESDARMISDDRRTPAGPDLWIKLLSSSHTSPDAVDRAY